jgi:hypothetical protein
MLSCVTALYIEENVAAMLVAATDNSLLVTPVAAADDGPTADLATGVTIQEPLISFLNNLTFHESGLLPTCEESFQDSLKSFPGQNPPNSFNERLDDIATDIIICTLVAAFVALQYCDIIHTCQ